LLIVGVILTRLYTGASLALKNQALNWRPPLI